MCFLIRRVCLAALFVLPLPGQSRPGKPPLMAVFAHPDDETTVAPLLARYAAEGHPVHLVCITSGQLGVNPDLPLRGDELGAAREEELRCAASKLSINPPILLRYQDQGISTTPVMDEIAGKLRALVEQFKPDVLITWGPEGITGHPDHRATSNITVQVFQEYGKLRYHPRKLYFVAWPESRFVNPPPPFSNPGFTRPVADALITTAVDCSKYLRPAYEASTCHKTQKDIAEMMRDDVLNSRLLGGRIFLREAFPTSTRKGAREKNIFSRR